MEKRAIVRQLLRRFDAAQVAELLALGVEEVERLADEADPSPE